MSTPNRWHSVRYNLIIVVVLTLWAEMGYAQYFRFNYHRKRASTPFNLIKNLVIIPVFINGNGPFNFVLDTGVGILLITDPSLRSHVANHEPRTVTINGIGEGSEMSALIYPSATIELGSNISGKMPVAILKEDPFNLSAFLGIPIHGLIGYELFSSFIVGINYTTKNITYYVQESPFLPKKGTRVPITIEERKPYTEAIVTLADGKQEKVKLIIDSGAGHPISLETNSGQPYNIPDKNIQANLGVGLSGIINGFISRIPAFQLGKFKLQNVICAFPDYGNVAAKLTNLSRNGNLGNNILKRFNIVFDYHREVMYLRPNYMYKEPFEHDMSGMEIIAEGENLEAILIARVETGSAADQVGLKKGDRILAVNFKKTSELGIDEVTSLFRSRDERSVVLEVQQKQSEETKFFVLTLKRRI